MQDGDPPRIVCLGMIALSGSAISTITSRDMDRAVSVDCCAQALQGVVSTGADPYLRSRGRRDSSRLRNSNAKISPNGDVHMLISNNGTLLSVANRRNRDRGH